MTDCVWKYKDERRMEKGEIEPRYSFFCYSTLEDIFSQKISDVSRKVVYTVKRTGTDVDGKGVYI